MEIANLIVRSIRNEQLNNRRKYNRKLFLVKFNKLRIFFILDKDARNYVIVRIEFAVSQSIYIPNVGYNLHKVQSQWSPGVCHNTETL